MKWLLNLNESQKNAVTHGEGPLFVVAGAGTGKTKTLTSRIAYLIESGVEADSILAVTFTNKAAKEMRQRVIDMTGPYSINVWLYTFHAFGLKILRRHINELPYGYQLNFSVIDEDDGKKIVHEQIKALGLDTKQYSVRALKNLIALFKGRRLEVFERSNEEKIYQGYQRYLKENQLLDFDDLLLYVVELFENYENVLKYYQTKFSNVLVDEFQDTDKIQYRILKLLVLKHRNAFVVGDPDQSIYAFRGANYENANQFISDFSAKKILLEKNYRSTNQILKAANKLIKNNFNRPTAKKLESDLGIGQPLIYHNAQNDYQEAFFVINEIRRLKAQGYLYEDMAILYRNNALSRLFEDVLIKEGIPYVIYGGISFYERKEIKDALAYIRVVLNSDQDFYLKRIINVPKRSIGLISLGKLEKKASELGVSMYEAIEYVDVTPAAKKNMKQFKQLIVDLKEGFNDMTELKQIMPFIMEKIGYVAALKMESSDINEDRIANIGELNSVFSRGDVYYEGEFLEKLNQQLDQIALYSDMDKNVRDIDHVKLATYHQVKGLEFKVVYMVVMEEGIFPSDRALYSTAELEEERRIAYVGITRTKEKLYMTYANKRMVYGTIRFSQCSRFIQESKASVERPKTIYKETQRTQYFKQGDHVKHGVFGKGIVVSVDDEIATIAFPLPHGVKKILESHPSLKRE